MSVLSIYCDESGTMPADDGDDAFCTAAIAAFVEIPEFGGLGPREGSQDCIRAARLRSVCRLRPSNHWLRTGRCEEALSAQHNGFRNTPLAGDVTRMRVVRQPWRPIPPLQPDHLHTASWLRWPLSGRTLANG